MKIESGCPQTKQRHLFALLATAAALATGAYGQEVLYNGIVMPANFPPARTPSQLYALPTYLTNPPAVIPIDLGRQLFVDDFLIEQTTLTRTQHRPVMYPGNPVLKGGAWPDPNPWAAPYSDGVWFDPSDQLFKMWYLGGPGSTVSYAYSTDGRNWTLPSIPDAAFPGTNRVIDLGGGRDSNTVWMDLEDPDPSRRFKAFPYLSGAKIGLYFSPDGIHWTKQANQIDTLNDRTTFFWNPFRKVWVNNIRGEAVVPAGITRPQASVRARYYAESKDLIHWNPANPGTTFWMAADENDPPYLGPGAQPPQMYALDAVAYESVMLGLFSFLHAGTEEDPSYLTGPNLVEINAGFSRDGFQWVRPTRGSGPLAFIPAGNAPGKWDGYNSQSVGGTVLVVGDELWFYFSGRSDPHYFPWATTPMSTGFATLRRDGFYSMDAGTTEGVLTTRPVKFSGKRFFVNVDDPSGQLRVEVLDANNNVIAPFTKTNSVPVSSNKTLREMRWSGVSDLSSLVGKTVKFRFYLTNGKLYSFWVTSNSNGASNGYVGAGGPGFTGPTDTIGGSVPPPDLLPPTVAITSPANGQTLSGNVTFTATASDNVGVAGIQFKVDGVDVGPEITAAPYSLSLSPASLQDGAHTITALARDTSGNSTLSLPVGVTIKNAVTPPVLSGGAPTGALPTGTTLATLAVSTNEAATCRYATSAGVSYGAMTAAFSVTGGLSHTVTVSGLASGTSYKYYVRCQDAAGNADSADYLVSFSVTPDTTLPTVSVISPGASQTVAGTITITASASDNVGVAGVQFKVDGNNAGQEVKTAPYSMSFDTTTLKDGPHGISATAKDAAGNSQGSAVVTVTFKNDITPPVVTGGAPTGTLAVGTTQTTVSVATNEPATCKYATTAGVAYAAMGNSFATTGGQAHSTGVTGLSNGSSYSYYVRCLDQSGNADGTDYVVSFSVSADNVAPTVSITAPGANQTVSGTVLLTASASDNVGVAGVQFMVDGSNVGSPVTAAPYTYSLDTTALKDGSHGVSATAKDGAGNSRTSAAVSIVVKNDFAPPIVSAGVPTGVLPLGTSQATVSVSTNEPATCKYAATAGGSYAAMTGAFTATGGQAHSFSVTGLQNGSSYTYYIRCQDASGNADSTDYPVSFSVARDTAVPTVGFTSPAANQTVSGNVVITVTATDNVGVTGVRVTVDGTQLGAELTAAPYAFNWNTTTLVNGNHTLTAFARDGAANTGSTSITVGVNNIPPDTAAPVISNGSPSGVLPANTTQVTLSVNTNEAATCKYSSAAGTTYPAMSGVFTSTGGLTHSGTITGLRSGTYNYYVRCQDVAGNADGADYPITFTIAAPIFSQYIEGEAGDPVSPMQKVTGDWTASRQQFIRTVQGNSGVAQYILNVPVDGAVVIWARVQSPSRSSGSFYVSMDGGQEEFWNVASQLSAAAKWEWHPVTGQSGATSGRQFNVSAGTHRFTFRGSAVNTFLDALVFSNDPQFRPPASLPVPDSTAPARQSGRPFGALAAGSSGTMLLLTTDEFATCRYSGTPGAPWTAMTGTFQTTGGTSHAAQVTGLADGGQYGYFVRCEDAAGNANGDDYPIYFSVASPGQAPGLYAQYFEAESGTVASPMTKVANSQASGGQFIRTVQNNQGTATYLLTVPAAGSYVLWGRVSSSSPAPDSFYVSIDGGAEDLWQSSSTYSWQWVHVTGQLDGT
jgi:hypothetical protein